MQVITAVLDIRTSNYNTLIHTGIKYDVLINIIKRRLTIILVYYTNVLCREEKGCNNVIIWMESLHKNIHLMLEFLKALFLVLHFSYYTLMIFLTM